MTGHVNLLPLILVAALVAACSGGTAATNAPATNAPATNAPSAAGPTAPPPSATPPSATPGGGSPASPTWALIELVDARTGETFRLADFAGRTVFIEPMAIWCTSCRRQQGEAKTALGRLDREQVLYVSLDVDPSESTEELGRYAEGLGFDWTFAVAPASLALALADEFGDQVLNPPSTPILLMRADGGVELIGFGHRPADELVAIANG